MNFTTASKGLGQARVRKNTIFYIQMLLARGIAWWFIGNEGHALSLFVLVGLLANSVGLKLTHEGISQLHVYFSNMAEECETAIRAPSQWEPTTSTQLKVESLVTGRLRPDAAREVIAIATDRLSEVRRLKELYSMDPNIFDP
jgi:hypothetical protein